MAIWGSAALLLFLPHPLLPLSIFYFPYGKEGGDSLLMGIIGQSVL